MRLLSKAVAAIACASVLGQSTVGVAQVPAASTVRPAPTTNAAPIAARPTVRPAVAPTAVATPATAPSAAPAPVSAAAMSPAELEAFVDGIVRDAMAADHIPGVTVSVVQNGQVLLKKGYGFAKLEPRPVAVDPDRTLFRIASISKTFTWIAVMREVEAGRMRLDAPVNLYLPEQVQVRDQGFTAPVRVRDLMSHTPGFEDRALGQLFEKDPARVRPQLTYLRQERPRREFQPGSTPAYSNYGVNLAGAAVSYVAQRPFERIIEQDITGPLGMTRTTFRDPYPARSDLPAPMSPTLAAGLADGFFWTGSSWRKRPYEFTSQGAPAGGASTTAGDMARYMTMLLNGGSLDGVTLFGPQTSQGFRTPQWRPIDGIKGTAHGFLPFTLPGNRTGWGHDGVLLSFRSSMIMVPELGLGVFVATNAEGGERLTRDLAPRIVQRFYGPAPTLPEPGSEWLKANASAFEGQYVANRRAFHGLEKFIGLVNSRVTVKVSDSGVLLIRGFDFTSRWVPVGTGGEFRQADGWRTLAFEMKDGRAQRYFSGGGVNSFERVGFFGGEGWLANLGLLALIASIATLVGVAMRFGQRDYRETPMQGRVSLIQTTQSVLWVLAAVTAGLWLSRTGDVAAIFFDWPGWLMLTASSCALVAALLSIANLALLPFVWRGGRRVDSWTTGRKLRFTLTALLFVAFSLVLATRGAIYPWAS